MRLNWTYAIVVVLATCFLCFALVTGGERINACECVEADSPAERRDEATAVFLGRVVGMQFENWPFDIDSALVPPDEPLTVEFTVRTVWKGQVSKILKLTTARSEPCGYPFKNHQDFLVYADGDEGSLEVRACSRTKPAAEAREDLEVLGEGRPPGPGTRGVVKPATLDCYASPKSTSLTTDTWPLILIAGIAWFGFRYRRRR